MASKPPDRGETSEGARGGDQITPLSLLERARSSDAEAWRQLVGLYRPLVLFWCDRGGVRGPDADDLAQEVFAAAALGLARFRRDRPGDTFRGWLRGITRNQILLHYRRSAGQPRAEGGSDAWARLQAVPDPLAGFEQEEEVEFGLVCHRIMEQVRDDFEEHTWRAFWLTVIENRSPAALAEELGMSTAAIRQAKSRVLRRLKQEVGELLE
jgi:RNA polymerase sigma-70 factor, ECF subfamily